MVAPLTKSTRYGELYSRPPHIEDAIAQAQEEDLATLIRPDHPFLTTEEYMDAVDAELRKRMQ